MFMQMIYCRQLNMSTVIHILCTYMYSSLLFVLQTAVVEISPDVGGELQIFNRLAYVTVV